MMKCPECAKSGKQSTVSALYSVSTAVHHAPFFDQQGRPHYHDQNIRTYTCQCSEGHTFDAIIPNNCHCGWKQDVSADVERMKKIKSDRAAAEAKAAEEKNAATFMAWERDLQTGIVAMDDSEKKPSA